MNQPKISEQEARRAGAPLSRSKRLAFTALLLSASVAVALALGEAAARAVGAGASAAAGEGGGEGLYAQDTLLGWRKRPNVTVDVRTAEYQVTESTNSLGLRGPETTESKPPGEKRVLLIGDSFLEGFTVDYDDLLSTRLETLLRSDSVPVEVLNAGTAGYSTDQELLYFQREGRLLAPDVTVLLFYVNDVYFNAHGSYWRGEKPYFELADTGLALRGVPVPPPDPDRFAFEIQGGRGLVGFLRRADAWLGSRSALHRLVREAVRNSPALSGLSIRLGIADVPGEFRAWQRTPDPEVQQAWDVTAALLERLSEAVHEAGSEFLVLYVPSRPAVYDDDWRRTRRAYAMSDEGWSPSADADQLSRICENLSLRCVIPIEQFRAAATGGLESEDRLYFPHDGHWTAAGHALAARLIAHALDGSL